MESDNNKAYEFTIFETLIIICSIVLAGVFALAILVSGFNLWFDIYMAFSSCVITIASFFGLFRQCKRTKFIATVLLLLLNLIMLVVAGCFAIGLHRKAEVPNIDIPCEIVSGVCWFLSIVMIFFSLMRKKE